MSNDRNPCRRKRLRLSLCPERGYGVCADLGIGFDLKRARACVQDDTTDESISSDVAEAAESLGVALVDGDARLHLDRHDLAVVSFEYKIDFVAIRVPKVR